MPIELQVSDLLSRVIERIAPSQVVVSEEVHFELPDPDTLVRVSTHEKTVYKGPEIRKDGFFRAHNIPDASRWVLNKNPHSIWDLFVKEQIVYIPPKAQA